MARLQEEISGGALALLRTLPQVGEVVESEVCRGLAERYSRELVVEAARAVVERIRAEVKRGEHTEATFAAAVQTIPEAVAEQVATELKPSLRKVINATGVILQTNLGRAPLSEAAVRGVVETARGYCNIEMDLPTGARSKRDVHAEKLVLRVVARLKGISPETLMATHAVVVVNNCAAATFLALNSIAEGGEVIVSRGELVEIGGGFRVPDILRKSGAGLREVGTTNRTRIGDYAEAMSPETRMLLRVHRSNFRIEGFTTQPTLPELIELGKQHGVPVFEDQGTGCAVRLSEFGVGDESSWVESVTSGADLVACSGDKLLGGPQCGLLVGRKDLIERVRKNPLLRALRVDKLTYAALQATLLAYLAGRQDAVPVVAMLRMSAEEVRQRCEVWAEALASEVVQAEVRETVSVIGGGTTPGATLPSCAVALRHASYGVDELAAKLRGLDLPIVGRVQDGRVLLDLRTVQSDEDEMALQALMTALGG